VNDWMTFIIRSYSTSLIDQNANKNNKIFYDSAFVTLFLALTMDESNNIVGFSKEKKVPRCKWTEKAIKSLLSFLKEHKEVPKELVKRRGGSGSGIKSNLWHDASNTVSDNENQYLPEQCEFKWKNIKRSCKVKITFL